MDNRLHSCQRRTMNLNNDMYRKVITSLNESVNTPYDREVRRVSLSGVAATILKIGEAGRCDKRGKKKEKHEKQESQYGRTWTGGSRSCWVFRELRHGLLRSAAANSGSKVPVRLGRSPQQNHWGCHCNSTTGTNIGTGPPELARNGI